MAQNIYDNQVFFDGYAQLSRSIDGLSGAPEWPAMQALLPNLAGLSIVDLGCGYGWFCRAAREQGAKQVLGLDLSQKMLHKAASMTNDRAIVYRQENLEQLTLPENQFDLAYSSLAFHYIEDLARLLATVFRALVPGGQLIFSAEHPIFTAPKNPGWLHDKAGQKSWPINGYQAEGARVTNWIAEGVIKQHRTLGTYINVLVEQGFMIRHLTEWGPSRQQIIDHPALDEEKERPMIFLLAATKPLNK